MKKKVLVLTSTFPRWKKDTTPPFVYELSKRLAKEFEIHVLAPMYPGAKKEEIWDGMKIHRFSYFIPKLEKLAGGDGILPSIKKNKLYILLAPFFVLAEIMATKKLVKKIKPEIIHAHWIFPQGVAALKSKIPYITTTHGGDIYGLNKPIFRRIIKKVLKSAKHNTVVSNAIKNDIKHIYKENNTTVLSMGVDSTKFKSNNKKRNIDILFVGRLAEKKGVKYLIESIKLVTKQIPKINCVIIGDGPLRNELEKLTKQLELGKNIKFLGALQNEILPQYYSDAKIFVGPSIQAKGGDQEGLGLTFVEACMAGCAVIATDLPAIKDVIKDNQTGIIVPQQSSGAIAKNISFLLNDDEKRKKIGDRGMEYSRQKFDWEKIKDKFAELLK